MGYNNDIVKLNRQTKIIVTGASHGIGRALSKELLARGTQVLGVSRSRGGQEPGNFTFLSVDLEDSEGRAQIVSWVKKNWRQFDILVNNAGVMYSEKVSESSLRKVREIMEVNFFAPLELMIKLLPVFREGGIIINVLSPAVFRNHPQAGFYAASKAALRSVTGALRKEMGQVGTKKIKVLGYHPGFVKTEIFKEGKHPSFLAGLLQVAPEFTAKQIIKQMEKSKEGEYYEPVARIVKLAGMVEV